MKIRVLLAGLLALGSVLPLTSAQADHCDSPIYVFTRTRIQTDIDDPTAPGNKVGRTIPGAASSAIGCDVIAEDSSEIPGDESDTDYIYPGSNRMSVRFFIVIQPVRATLEFAGQTHELTMTRAVDVTGEPDPWYDSNSVVIDASKTFSGETATATVCIEENEEEICYSRVYRTIQ